RQRAELAVARRHRAAAEPAREIPAGIELRDAAERSEFVLARRVLVNERERRLEMVIDRLARDEQPHDLRGPLEDQIDTKVAHRALDRDPRLAAAPQRVGGLVATATADLQRVVDDPP